ncbi:TetR/AcrR family transcriptional regulator [Vitreimonas sp.]|uniref:TetR/AcrR family transcriptional regulator n=1 Tax=Vitreimonas sp. TaxID=3069702 RepID=UPI002ED831CC
MPLNAPVSGASSDRGVVRRRAFLETALTVFCERGYEHVNVNDIVRQAGGSLATLYSQFGNKEGLFLAVLEECNSRIAAALCPVADPSLELRDGLQRIGEHYLRRALAPESCRFFKMICAASGEFPDAVKESLRVGPNRVASIVADYTRERAPLERVVFADHDEAALAFFALVRGQHQYRAILEDDYRLSDEEISQHVRAAVRIILQGAARQAKHEQSG